MSEVVIAVSENGLIGFLKRCKSAIIVVCFGGCSSVLCERCLPTKCVVGP